MPLRILTLTLSCFIALPQLLTSFGPSAFAEELPPPTAVPVAIDPAARQRSVQVDIQLIEIPEARLRELGVGFATISEDAGEPTTDGGVLSLVRGKQYDPRQLNQFLNALKEHDLARILAEPRLVTLDGRPATIEINAEVALDHHRFGKPAKKKMTGMRVKVLPQLIGLNRCRVELRLDWSGIVRDEQGMVRIRKHQLDTAFTTESGKTMVVSTTTAQDTQTEYDHTLLVLVTPTVSDAPEGNPRTATQSTERR